VFANKTIYRTAMGQKIKLQTLVHIFTKYWWILKILLLLDRAEKVQCRFTTPLTTF